MSIPIVTQIERLLRKKLNPLIIPSYDPRATPTDLQKYPEKGWLYVYVHARVQVILRVKLLRVCIGSPVWYNVIGFIFTFSTMNYIIQPFPLQSWWVLCTFYLANLVYIHIKTRVSTTATGRGPLLYLEASTTFLIFCSLWHIICWSYFLLQFERAQRKGSNGNTLKAFEYMGRCIFDKKMKQTLHAWPLYTIVLSLQLFMVIL